MNKNTMKMTAMAVTLAGMMASMGAAHAVTDTAQGSTLELRAAVAQATCDITVGNTKDGNTLSDFGTLTPDDFVQHNTSATAYESKQGPLTMKFDGCKGADIAADGEVKLVVTGPSATGSGNVVWGDPAKNTGIGFDLKSSFTVADPTTNAATAPVGSQVLNPGASSLTIYKNPSAEQPVNAPDAVMPDVTITPRLWSYATTPKTDIGAVTLDTFLSLGVAYN